MKQKYLLLTIILFVFLFLFSTSSLALIPGDFGSAGGGPPDGYVDFEDLMIFAMAYGSTPADANWNEACDIASEGGILQPDGVIDFEDLMIFAMNYGEVEPSPDWLGTPQLDPDTIFTEEATDVRITILVNCDPEELSSESPVNVFLQNDNAEWILLGEMFDDGDLDNHGDEIKGDRIYSNIFSFYEENEKTIPLKIVVISSVNETYIVYCELEVIASVGEESIQEVKNIHGLAEQKLNDIVEGPGIDTEEILDVLGGYLNEQTGVESTVVDGNLLQINYESGIISFILLEDITAEPTLGSMVRESTPSIPLSQQTTGTNVLEVKSGLYDSSFQITKELDDVVYTGSRSVLIWVPFAAQIKDWGYNVVSDFVTRFENSTLGFNITTVEDEEADVDSLKNNTDYDGMVIFTTHGAKGNWLATGEVVPWYLINPIYGLWLKLKHMAIWQNMKVEAEGGVLISEPVYAVSSGWFNSNLSGNFSNTIILNMSCESAKTDALWNTFKGKGAGAYFGFDAIVTAHFATEQGYDLVEKLREGDLTTGEAYQPEFDPYYTPGATWLIWGKENLKFPTVINIAAIPGVTAPVIGATPVTTITETAQYTGTVTWSPVAATFAGATQYTATITLTPKTGYTLPGVSENFFTVAGATTVTNTADSGVVTAVFPETVLAVGDSYGGGIVAYILQSGDPGYDESVQHGLIAATSDQGSAAWSNITNFLLGTTGTALGTGQANTTAIVGQAGCTSGAAKLCDDLTEGTNCTSTKVQLVVFFIFIITTTGVRRSTLITARGASFSAVVIRPPTASTMRPGFVLFGLFNYLSI